MLDKVTKAAMETSIQDNFRSVALTIPPAHTVTANFKLVVRHLGQDTLDELMNSDKNYVVVGMDFPSADLPWERVISDIFGVSRTHELEAEQLFAAGDWTVVNGAITAVFTFTMSEAMLSQVGFYVEKVAASTSWLSMAITDENGTRIHSKTYMPSQIPDNTSPDWVYERLWKQIELNYPGPVSGTFTVTFTEIEMGANPIGIHIGKSGVNVAYRTYHGLYGETVGKLNRAVVRLNIYAKDKKIRYTPQVRHFMGKDDIVIQVADLLRKHIRSNWRSLGLNDIQSMSLGQVWNSEVVPLASLAMDVLVTSPDLAQVVTPELPMKDIDIDIQYGM